MFYIGCFIGALAMLFVWILWEAIQNRKATNTLGEFEEPDAALYARHRLRKE